MQEAKSNYHSPLLSVVKQQQGDDRLSSFVELEQKSNVSSVVNNCRSLFHFVLLSHCLAQPRPKGNIINCLHAKQWSLGHWLLRDVTSKNGLSLCHQALISTGFCSSFVFTLKYNTEIRPYTGNKGQLKNMWDSLCNCKRSFLCFPHEHPPVCLACQYAKWISNAGLM